MYLLRTCVPVCAYVDHLWNYVCVVHVPLTYLRAPEVSRCEHCVMRHRGLSTSEHCVMRDRGQST